MKITKTFQLLSLIFFVIINSVTCPMAHNIYSNPDLSKTSRKFDTFTIDFKGIETPNSTYWALCNFQLDLTEFKKTHAGVSGGGAYGGLQTVINGKTAILSFWEIKYKENNEEKILRANRVYPSGSESSFGNEGEGNNYITPFDWKTGVWNRWVLKSWKDTDTGNTFVGEWVGDLFTGEWNLITYFNTNLKNSYITGGLSQFQENFYDKYYGVERSFNIKNMYAYDIEKNAWISLDTSTLSYDPASWGYNTAGTHEFGYTSSYFYGSAGVPVDNQAKYDDVNPMRLTGTISQSSTPSKLTLKPTVTCSITSKTISVNWSINKKHAPIYKIEIGINKVNQGNFSKVHSRTVTRPDRTYYSLSSIFSGSYSVAITFYGIFGEIANESCSGTV